MANEKDYMNNGHILALRTCDADLRSYNGFQWKAKGVVEAPDFQNIAYCGNGLHALEWGIGDGELLDWSEKAKWLVVEVEKKSIVDLDGKIKFPKCNVIHCGDRVSALDMLLKANKTLQGVVGGFVKAGDREAAIVGYKGTATAGNYGTATAGNEGTATAGDRGTATAGDEGTATAGNRGTATAGSYGTATAGHRGTATAGSYGTATAGNRGTATAGHRGTATAGHRGTATAGNYGTATAGDRGTATAGSYGTATAGEKGILIIEWYDRKKCGYFRSVGLIDGKNIEPSVPYKLNENGAFVKVTK